MSVHVDTIVRWRADTKLWKPVEVACPDGLWPARDSDGEKIFDNTHFETENEAWSKLKSEAESYVSMTGNMVKTREEALLKAQIEAAEAAKMFETYIRNRDSFNT